MSAVDTIRQAITRLSEWLDETKQQKADATAVREDMGLYIDFFAQFEDGGGAAGELVAQAYLQSEDTEDSRSSLYTAFLKIANQLLDLMIKAMDGVYAILGTTDDPQIEVPKDEVPPELQAVGAATATVAEIPPQPDIVTGAIWIPAAILIGIAGLAAVLYKRYESVIAAYRTEQIRLDQVRIRAIEVATREGRDDIARALAERPLGQQKEEPVIGIAGGLGIGTLLIGGLAAAFLVLRKS